MWLNFFCSPNQGNHSATHSQNFAILDRENLQHHNDPPVDDDAGKFTGGMQNSLHHLRLTRFFFLQRHRQNEYVALPRPFSVPFPVNPRNLSHRLPMIRRYLLNRLFRALPATPCLNNFGGVAMDIGVLGIGSALLTYNYSQGYLQLRQAVCFDAPCKRLGF